MQLEDVKIGLKVKIVSTLPDLHPLYSIGTVSEIDNGSIEVTIGNVGWWYEACELRCVEDQDIKNIINKINESFLSSPVNGVTVLDQKDWIIIVNNINLQGNLYDKNQRSN